MYYTLSHDFAPEPWERLHYLKDVCKITRILGVYQLASYESYLVSYSIKITSYKGMHFHHKNSPIKVIMRSYWLLSRHSHQSQESYFNFSFKIHLLIFKKV